MNIGDKIKVGYAEDFTGLSTRKYWIIDETISGKFVCQRMPEVMTFINGRRYISYQSTSLFLKDKSEVSNVQEEEIK